MAVPLCPVPPSPMFPRAVLALAATATMASCSVPRLGVQDGRLLPCPESPNCACSLATDPRHRVEPLPLRRPAEATLDALAAIGAALPRSTLLERSPGYLRFQVASLLFRFKDDLEFHLVPAEGVVHLRSASRTGYYDFGVNRARVAAVRRAYEQWLAGGQLPGEGHRSGRSASR